MGEPQKKYLGEMLIEKGLITKKHIEYALQEQKITKEVLGEVLTGVGFVTEYDVAVTLADQAKVPFHDLNEVLPETKLLKLFNKNLCLSNTFLPLQIKEREIEVATASIFHDKISQIISRQTGLKAKFYIAEKKKIINAINGFYYFLENPVEKLIETEVNILSQDREMARSLETLIKHILHFAVKMRATDIHIRPMSKSVNISFRIDGVMTSMFSIPDSLKRIVASLKMKADMDIAEQRLPQDGRFRETILNNFYDFRVSTLLSIHGENMVIRLLPLESSVLGMEQLGFFKEDVKIIENMFNEPFGIILLTGPTGSGKSTTLYAGIRSLNLLEKNVLTVEDPIEYQIPLLRQTQVNEKAGYTFANATRYFLRHDPDVILVGEIRDKETAATAVTASITGHLVLSTLHANSSVGAIPRLRDLGIRGYLIGDSLIGVVSQRLVRKICSACKEAYAPEEWEKNYINENTISVLHRGTGCKVCSGTGYFGRTLVYEILTVDKELSGIIENEGDMKNIYEISKKKGFVDMFDITVKKISQGITTTREALRVLGNITSQ